MAEEDKKIIGAQFIGVGPACLGVFRAAAQNGKFEQLRHVGITLIEKFLQRIGSGLLGEVTIESNSAANEFIGGLELEGSREAFGDVTSAKEYEDVEAYTENVIPLNIVGRCLHLLGNRLADKVREKGRVLEKGVGCIQYDTRTGVYTTFSDLERQQQIEQSRAVVLSVGGHEPIHEDLEPYSEKVIPSGQIFTESGITKIKEEIANKDLDPTKLKIVIAGGSHSAFAAANVLLKAITGLSEGAISVLTRSEVKEFYETPEDATLKEYPYGEDDVCEETQRIHRFGGVRAKAGELSRKIRLGEETRVSIIQSLDGIKDKANQTLLSGATFIVQALGYTPRYIPILNESGEVIGPVLENGRVKVGPNYEVYATINGKEEILPGAFATGLGHSVSASTSNIGGEKSFKGEVVGVNFSVKVGKVIAENLLQYCSKFI